MPPASQSPRQKARTASETPASSPKKMPQSATKASRKEERAAAASNRDTTPGQTYNSDDDDDAPLTKRAQVESVLTSTLMPTKDSGIFPVFPMCA